MGGLLFSLSGSAFMLACFWLITLALPLVKEAQEIEASFVDQANKRSK
jgi:hypothetical protein